MTVVLRAVPTGGSGGGGSTAPANNARGDVVGLVPAASQEVISIPAAQFKLRGFVAFGSTDGLFWVEVDGVPLAGITARCSIVKVATLILPNPETITGTTVALKVRNEGDVSGSFEGTLLGE